MRRLMGSRVGRRLVFRAAVVEVPGTIGPQYIALSGPLPAHPRGSSMASFAPLCRRNLRMVAVAVALAATGFAQADEYGDVNQLLRQGKPSEALARADQFLAGKPRDPQMRFLRGVI